MTTRRPNKLVDATDDAGNPAKPDQVRIHTHTAPFQIQIASKSKGRTYNDSCAPTWWEGWKRAAA